MGTVKIKHCDLCGRLFKPDEISSDGFSPPYLQSFHICYSYKECIKCWNIDLCNECINFLVESILQLDRVGRKLDKRVKDILADCIDKYLKELNGM